MPNNSTSTAFPIQILAFGELLWDMLPTGKKLGGAPVNFSYHAQTLGANVRSLTRIGPDDLGREITERFVKLGLSQDALQTSSTAPTGTVDVKLDAKGDPTYSIVENVAWDEINVDSEVIAQIKTFLDPFKAKSAFYFGSLALRSSNNKVAVTNIISALPPEVLRVCDLNLRAPFFDRETVEFTLDKADVFKLNDLEAVELSKMFADKTVDRLSALADTSGSLSVSIVSDFARVKQELSAWAQDWLSTFNLTHIILTCGSEGAFIFDQENVVYAPSQKVDVKDCVGAGDSFAAVCTVGILRSEPLPKIIEAASERAAFVCSQEGGTPSIPQELTRPFDN